MFSIALSQADAVQAQTASRDSTSPVYHLNYWVTGGICVAGAAGGLLTIPVRAKPNFTDADLLALNSSSVPSYDRWSLRQDASLIPTYENYSLYLQIGMAAAPLGLLLDGSIRKDWGDVLLMAMEVNAVVVSFYTISPLGPSFQTRYRPVVYYPDAPVDRHNGNNKNSFYSGHVASASAAAFFMAKVLSDYHPELGADKYWLYAAASVPSLAMAYARLKALDHFPSDAAVGLTIGTVCGILIPELHRIGTKDMSLGVYSSPEGSGVAMHWRLETASK
ncbi:MAG: phosphatase PAP2 family protein [Bacteroidota bacterium]|nr:phosphatase PAP2 family protein [Bacteroidota bacterium]MDP4288906.1 phosphatase PAP2 family protein [Bacteroidota bacterium]